jgi:outer membrane protein assembly factor BamB
MVIALLATRQIIDKSLSTAMMGMMFPLYSIPILCSAFVVWTIASQRFSIGLRRITMFATIVIASGFWILLRTNGMDGESHQDFAWRWAKTAEERLISGSNLKSIAGKLELPGVSAEAEWPGFRGLHRDGIIHGEKIKIDWKNSPPVEIWRKAVGPGCGSLAIQGSLLYTQEQRGEYELVTCYNLLTGELLWSHGDSTRFWDSHAGAGPRSTPCLNKGRVFTLGATGFLNALDATNGNVLWSRHAEKDNQVKLPGWGYAGSPLVTDSLVIVAISGKIAAYNILSGAKRWSGGDTGECYSSPHLLKLGGVEQIVFMSSEGTTSFAPGDGKILWTIPLKGSPIVQPAIINESELLINSGVYTKELRHIAIKKDTSGWSAKELWTTTKLRPDFNDIIVHKGCVYGFDGASLVCLDLANGERMWKGSRYGGQIILLADQDLLIVLSEKGELVIVKARPEKFDELARIPAIKGKTWNHPVLVGNILVVRNSEEMAAFRLATE